MHGQYMRGKCLFLQHHPTDTMDIHRRYLQSPSGTELYVTQVLKPAVPSAQELRHDIEATNLGVY